MLTYKFSLFTRNILIGEKINGRTRYSQVRQLQKVCLPWKMKYPLETWNNQHPLQNGIKTHKITEGPFIILAPSRFACIISHFG